MARMNRPQPQLTNSSQALTMRVEQLQRLKFDDLRNTPEAGREGTVDARKDQVVLLGRDTDLEALIAIDIREAAAAYEPQGGPWIIP